jgi:hypothetical protein
MQVSRRAAALAAAALLLAAGLRAQPADSLRADSLVIAAPTAADSAALPSPRGALLRSLALPGWGQVYVGQPGKAPIVAGALVGVGGLAVYLTDRYLLYRRAARYAGCVEVPGRPECAGFEADEDDWQATGARSFAETSQLRDDLKRNRDLALLGAAAVYALQALDAYVAAHLAGFDVSEDLALRVVPTPEGPAALLVVRW